MSRQVYTPGSLVRYYYIPEKYKHKFAKPWLGPFRILDQISLVDHRIECVGTPNYANDIRVVHVDHLKPYETNEVSHGELHFPLLILDWDYTDPALLQDRQDYQDFLQPLQTKGIQILSQRLCLRTSLIMLSLSHPLSRRA